ncbi:MAG: bifunctional phosphoserine phosphatase/homoserine phosphotransferase ThrH [Spirochaetaceae bacterium]|jgi:phosphoserine/homoserine phosphotransferase|nr:bifunctional phosphoserine phosphatase/homoserine phosphotransferase ThrH [Spirochaetaceae bacterium]
MKLVCLDLEGVLTPEIWIAFAAASGIAGLARTTRDEPDYQKLMAYRLDILADNNLKLADIQRVIAGLEPLDGALAFLDAVREKTQLVILSDTFEQFAAPLMRKLRYPTLFCNALVCGADGAITGWQMRQDNGKREAVRAFKSCNIDVFAAGDSYNDLAMIYEAGSGCLFRAPEGIQAANPGIRCVESYAALFDEISAFLGC